MESTLTEHDSIGKETSGRTGFSFLHFSCGCFGERAGSRRGTTRRADRYHTADCRNTWIFQAARILRRSECSSHPREHTLARPAAQGTAQTGDRVYVWESRSAGRDHRTGGVSERLDFNRNRKNNCCSSGTVKSSQETAFRKDPIAQADRTSIQRTYLSSRAEIRYLEHLAAPAATNFPRDAEEEPGRHWTAWLWQLLLMIPRGEKDRICPGVGLAPLT